MSGRTAGPGPRRAGSRYHDRGEGRGEDRDDGQVTILVIGFAVVLLLLTVVVMGVTAVYVGERKLQVLTDNAALAAADTFVALEPGTGGAPPVTVLDDDAVAGAATAYLDTVSAWAGTPGLALAAPTGSPDGRTAEVTLAAVVHPPVVNLLVPDGIPITATSEARARLGR
ncbi:pilus assembly protein TadG-related protein [Kocuria rosea]|uniref:pilus assembly protein TadG-related protein n=1 Tax=Kocuria rosea TaxID=1275 RepID=UPI002541A26B|nr:pilus assembly protein TadG-related protein [Kocuria rosea]WIG18506.1 pilus assembly protein TadG-related protein [Kocuria rosea]